MTRTTGSQGGKTTRFIATEKSVTLRLRLLRIYRAEKFYNSEINVKKYCLLVFNIL